MREITIDQFAVVNILFQFYSFDYFLESAAKIGFRKIDLWTGYPHMLLDNDYEKQCGEIRKKCDDMGLQIANVMPKVIGWPLNIADEDDKIRNRAVDYLKRAIDAAEILGAPSLQLVPGTGLYDQPVEPAWQRSRDSLCRVSEYAEKKGKQLALEAIQIVESNLVGNKETLFRMVSEVNSPALGAVVDTTHMEKNGESLDEYFELLGTKIKRIHLNESDQLPWGEGHAPIQVYLNQIRRAGYKGEFSIEICSRTHYLKPYITLKNTYEYLEDALRRQTPLE